MSNPAQENKTDDDDDQHDDDNINIITDKTKPKHVTLFTIKMNRDTAYYIVSMSCLLCCIASFIIVATSVSWTAFIWRFYTAFGCFMAFCIVVAEVNHFNKFHFMTSYFHRYRYTLCAIFFLFALADFILLELSDVQDGCDWANADDTGCPVLNPEEGGVRYITRFLTMFCGVLFLCCVMAFWERVSFYSAHSTWVIAILYMTVIGAIFLYFARCLEPPPSTDSNDWSWHQHHSLNKMLKIIVNIMILIVSFFVIMGAIVLALFGDAASASSTLGTWSAMVIFIFIAHIIMISPLAPGSVVDVCAGFLFVTLFVNNEGLSIEYAFFISLIITICLHFSGSCCQYYVGKIPSVQIWANKIMPPDMLAASDSVLKTANWFKVGVVGQVFMDTMGGLNQGRMDMDFCTQFWSEYASIPNAIGLVALGTVLAIPSFSTSTVSTSYDWAEDAIPLVIMITTLWQMIASSWGAKELLSSSGTIPFWTSLEKWTTVQYYYHLGYIPTLNGWKNDCFQLGRSRRNNDDQSSLYDIIYDYRMTKLDKTHIVSTCVDFRFDKRGCCKFCKSLCQTPNDPHKIHKTIQQQQKLNNHAIELRKKHWLKIDQTLDELIKNDELIKTSPKVEIKNLFQDSTGFKLIIHSILVLCIFVTGLCSYLFVSKPISLADAVQFGVNVLGSSYVAIEGWICLIIFWSLIIIYFYREFMDNLLSMINAIKYIFSCKLCKNDDDHQIETVFNTPNWDNAPKEFKEFQSKTIKSKNNLLSQNHEANISDTSNTDDDGDDDVDIQLDIPNQNEP